MIPLFAISIAVLLAGLALWGAGAALLGHAPDRRYLLAVGVIEAELIVQAVIALIRLISGHDGTAIAPFLGYLFVSIVLLPVVWRPGSVGSRSRWDSAIIAAVCVAVAVAVLRLVSLW